MAIEIREPPIIPDKVELSMWLQELRRLLVDEIDTIRALAPLIATNPTITYWGSPGVDGTWRLRRTNNDFVVERRESSVYVEKFLFQAV